MHTDGRAPTHGRCDSSRRDQCPGLPPVLDPASLARNAAIDTELFRLIDELRSVACHWQADRPRLLHGCGHEIQALTGHSRDDFVSGRVEFLDLIHIDDRGPVLEALSRAAGGGDYDIQFRLTDAEGRQRRIREQGRYASPNGAPAHFEAILTDLTACHEAADRLQTGCDPCRGLMNQLPAILCRLAGDGTTLYVNGHVRQVTGYGPDELIGRNWWETFYPEGQAVQVAALFDRLGQGDVRGHEMTLLARDGGPRIIRWSSLSRRKGGDGIDELLGVGVDVTESLGQTEVLARLRNDLGERVKELNCLYRISQIVGELEEGLPLGEGLRRIVHLIPPSFRWPDRTRVRLTLDGEVLTTPGFAEIGQTMSCPVWIDDDEAGMLEVFVAEPEGAPFLPEERPLLETIAQRIGKLLSRVRARARIARQADREQYYESLLENATDPILVVDKTGRVVYTNPSVAEAMGYQAEELLGADGWQFIHPDDADAVREVLVRAFANAGEQQSAAYRACHKDGTYRLYEANCRVVRLAGEQLLIANSRDVTDRVQAERDLQRVNRTLRMISECNQTLVKASDEQELVEAICRIVVEMGGYRLAWVGLADGDDAKTVRPVACSCDSEAGTDYVLHASVSWADEPRGHGPVGTAIRTGQMVLVHDTQSDEGFAPWRDEAVRRGYRSCIAMPLTNEDGVFGALAIYADQSGVFNDEELRVLDELAGDLAFGITTIRLRQQRERADAETRRLNRALRMISACNQTLVKADNEKGLLDAICRIIIEAGGYRMAWVGMVGDDPAGTIRPVAVAGDHPELVHAARITSDDSPHGLGPSGRAARTGRAVLIDDARTDPGTAAWRDELDRYGYGSIIAMPLTVDGETFGTLTVYGDDSGELGYDELAILSELADDLAYGISTLRARAAHERTETSLRRLMAAADGADDWVAILDPQGRYEYANQAALRLTGLDRGDLVGRRSDLLDPALYDESTCAAMQKALAEGRAFECVLDFTTPGGQVLHLGHSITPVRDAEGKLTHFFSNARDHTEHRRQAEEVRRLTQFDSLTGLPNRRLFRERLDQAIQRGTDHDHGVAVLGIDVDRFILINERFGQQTGDRLIKAVGRRLTSCVREGDCLARMSGDNFAAALVDLSGQGEAVQVIEAIRQVFSRPFNVEGQRIYLTVSIGVAMFPDDGQTADDLIKDADVALSFAAAGERNSYRFYTAELNRDASELMEIETGLIEAVDREQFFLHYQPYYNTSDGQLVGAEALLRWNSPDLGVVSPGRFIPVLEGSGQIRPATRWVLEEVCRQIVRWREQGRRPVPVAVNLSPVVFGEDDFADRVAGILADHGVPAELVTLEITESILMSDDGRTRRTLARLEDAGHAISIDDFGTGYSSLRYLVNFQVDHVKIDMSFIRDISDNVNSASIVKAIISMAHEVGFTTIAEGVETDEQLRLLRLLRCDMVQGFFLARPMEPDQLAEQLPPP